MLQWAQDLAEQLGLVGVPFFTQSCAVSSIYYHFNEGNLRMPLEGSTVSIPFFDTFICKGSAILH